jgi:hypothetical protein
MVKRQSRGKSSRKGRSEGSAARPGVPQISSEEALKFIRKMQKEFPRPPKTRRQKERLQEYLAEFTDAQLKAVGRRVQSDLMFGGAPSEHHEVNEPRPSGSRKKSKATSGRQRR